MITQAYMYMYMYMHMCMHMCMYVSWGGVGKPWVMSALLLAPA